MGNVDWEKIALKLFVYAKRRTNGLYWRGVRDGSVPGGKELKDFVQNAIAVFLTKPHKWSLDGEELMDYLKNLLSSEVSGSVNKSENRAELRFAESSEEANLFYVDVARIEARDADASPHSKLSDPEQRHLLLSMLPRDSVDFLIMTVVLDENIYEPRKIAKRLDIKIKDVNNAKKRLRRRYAEFGNVDSLAARPSKT